MMLKPVACSEMQFRNNSNSIEIRKPIDKERGVTKAQWHI